MYATCKLLQHYQFVYFFHCHRVALEGLNLLLVLNKQWEKQ